MAVAARSHCGPTAVCRVPVSDATTSSVHMCTRILQLTAAGAALLLRGEISGACFAFCCAPVRRRMRASVAGASAAVALRVALGRLVKLSAPPEAPHLQCEARALKKRP